MEITITGIEHDCGEIYLNLTVELDGEAHGFMWDVLGNCFCYDLETPWDLKSILHDNAQHLLMAWAEENVLPEISGLVQRLSDRFADTRIGL